MTRATPASERARTSRARGRGLLDAIGLALGRPSAWPVALAGFLARGGILLFVLPVVVLPTPTGLATLFGPDIIAMAMAGATPTIVRLVATAVLLAAGWLLIASLIGAVSDVTLARWTASAIGSDVPSRPRRASAALVIRVAVLRLACHLPLLVVAVWSIARIANAVYREYISPGDLAVSLPLRVLRSAPEAVLLLVVAWLIGEALGGLAARQVTLERRPMVAAIRRAAASLVLHPISAGVGFAASVLALAILALPIGAAAVAWGALRHELLGAGDPARVLEDTLAFAALWLGGLAIAGAGSTLRASIWTWHALRARSTVPLALGAPRPTPESNVAEA